MSQDTALAYMESRRTGLTEGEAATRLDAVGANILSSTKPLAWWRLLLSVIPNPFNVLLILLAVLSVAAPPPNWSTFIILIVMVVASVTVRFWQEYRSGIAAIKLQASVTTSIQVRRRRGGHDQVEDGDIDVKNLVPGDILLLNPGDHIPADCVLLQSSHLQVAQSSLTGESEPQHKTTARTGSTEKPADTLFDVANIVLAGTNAVSGTATALVLRTGDDTFIATIVKQMNEKQPVNSFQRGVRGVSFMLIGFMIVMATAVLIVSGKVSHNWGSAALFSLSVAVGLVPEMLPAIVNANLARGAFLLAKKQAIVKRLDAIQNLGGMTVLCSDKTGTLTIDEISLHCHEDCQSNSSEQVLQLAYTAAYYQSGKKNVIDEAIVKEGESDGTGSALLYGDFVAEIPFNFEKRRSSVIVRGPETNKLTLICKGAFEEVFNLCTRIRLSEHPVDIESSHKARVSQRAADLNGEGYRVVAVVTKTIKEQGLDEEEISEDLESQMVLEGLLTFLDPPKDDAAESILLLRELAVETKVLTGDNLGVAMKVCRSINLTPLQGVEDDIRAITGPELAQLSRSEFDEAVRSCAVLAKLTPSQKGEVIMSLKKAGHTVGMLGDGINDGIALRSADIGISVDTGTSIAKDCADVILTKKELSIIIDCVKTGRLTHGNTIKYIKMVASSNFGNVLSILIASMWFPYQPLTSLQILVQNLLYDISQIVIPWDYMDREYLQRPQRWSNKDLIRFIAVLGPTSSTIDMCTFCLGWFYYGIRSADDEYEVALFRTHWFLQGLLTQTLIVHLLRTAKIPIVQRRAAPILLGSTLFFASIGLCLPYFPAFARALGFVRPKNSFLGFLAAELLFYCLEVQAVKVIYIKLFGTWL